MLATLGLHRLIERYWKRHGFFSNERLKFTIYAALLSFFNLQNIARRTHCPSILTSFSFFLFSSRFLLSFLSRVARHDLLKVQRYQIYGCRLLLRPPLFRFISILVGILVERKCCYATSLFVFSSRKLVSDPYSTVSIYF